LNFTSSFLSKHFVVCGLLLGGFVDFAKKRRGGCSWKRPSYYLVERTVVFSECTLPVRTWYYHSLVLLL
jgi:hypothetical protein